ncbi:hypothetical protein BB8028_0005g11840 [Beauveria bassiana]|uniref:Major facilitator superfamily (MFS) profile domain-containing protein n=2 Tax=Beauveria bassiana TaxID=176275 RepID=A0A2S7YIJ4_BEABA|nr:putative MFS-type transporter PB1E7.08c [Beauveria bassiana D1-5]PQK15672.1 hypothetical protein BB8028_0005g11840 [Beauveria bassiana]
MSSSNVEQQNDTVEAATTSQWLPGKEKEQNPQLHNFALVDRSIQQIGLGRYQWRMFLTCGFGFFLDSMLPASVGIVLPQIVKQWSVKYPSMILLPGGVGALLGALLCGMFADFVGRIVIWRCSLLLVAVFTLTAAASPNFTVLSVFLGLQTLAAGGNFAVDLAVFAEMLPKGKGYMITAITSWSSVGVALGGYLAWPLITFYSCPQYSTPQTCRNSDNMGWRYQYVLIGGLSLIAALIRIFVMKMEESPKWLVAMGRFDDAVVILKKMATVNRTLVDISPQDFQPITVITTAESHNVSHLALIKRLFANRKLAYSTSGILLLWMCKGIATPLYGIYLPIYLQNNGAKLGNGSTFQTYRDYAISNTVAILAPIFATAIIDFPVIGRRRGVAITAACAAAFCGGFTSVRTAGANIAFSSMVSFWQTACYAMVFSYTPEVMPTASRATGCGLAFACGRLAFLAAPFIATFGDLKTSVPLWVVFGLLGLIAVTALSLPYEPKDFPED